MKRRRPERVNQSNHLKARKITHFKHSINRIMLGFSHSGVLFNSKHFRQAFNQKGWRGGGMLYDPKALDFRDLIKLMTFDSKHHKTTQLYKTRTQLIGRTVLVYAMKKWETVELCVGALTIEISINHKERLMALLDDSKAPLIKANTLLLPLIY